MAKSLLDTVVCDVVRDWGWEPGNIGENRVIRALHAAGVRPREVVQQFRLGPYRLDFAWPAMRMGIEADGWVHTTREMRQRDKQRDAILTDWGWLVVRLDIDRPEDSIIDEVAQFVQQMPRLCVRRAQAELKRYSPMDRL